MAAANAGASSGLLAMARATFVRGRWHKPELNARAIARLRKDAALAGEEFPLPLPPVRQVVPKERGHRYERLKAQR